MSKHLSDKQLIRREFHLDSPREQAQAQEHLAACENCRTRLAELRAQLGALELLRGQVRAPEELLVQTAAQATAGGSSLAEGARPWYRRPAVLARAAAVMMLLAGGLLTLAVWEGAPWKQGSRRTNVPPVETLAPADQPSEPTSRGVEDKVALSAPSASSEGGPLDAGQPVERAYALDRSLEAAMAPPAPPQAAPAPTARLEGPSVEVESVAEPAPAGKPMALAGRPVAELPSGGAGPTGAAESGTFLAEGRGRPFAPASKIELVTLPRREQSQLTIYNSADLTLVRDRRELTLKRGWNWLQFMWAGTLIDPTSLSLEPLDQKDRVRVEELDFPAGLTELGRWLVWSEVSGRVPFEITYLTSGLKWRAFYEGTLAADEQAMRLKGYVRVANGSGEDYEDAQVRLIVGQVHLLDQIADLARRKEPYGRPLGPMLADRLSWSMYAGSQQGCLGGGGGMMLWNGASEGIYRGVRLAVKDIEKEGLSEYFLYTIEGAETIPDGWAKRLVAAQEQEVPVESLYKYDQGRYGAQTVRFISFANNAEHKLGQTPLPDGQVRVYRQVDEAGRLGYVGAAAVKYIPVNEKVELNLGGDEQVKVQPKLLAQATANYLFHAPHGDISGWDDLLTWRIEIANTRTIPIKLEITREFPTPAWRMEQVSDGCGYVKHDATRARFTFDQPARSKRELNYTVRLYQGERQQALNGPETRENQAVKEN